MLLCPYGKYGSLSCPEFLPVLLQGAASESGAELAVVWEIAVTQVKRWFSGD
jgi:hypothetical protein